MGKRAETRKSRTAAAGSSSPRRRGPAFIGAACTDRNGGTQCERPANHEGTHTAGSGYQQVWWGYATLKDALDHAWKIDGKK